MAKTSWPAENRHYCFCCFAFPLCGIFVVVILFCLGTFYLTVACFDDYFFFKEGEDEIDREVGQC